jgi:hypothetical protein
MLRLNCNKKVDAGMVAWSVGIVLIPGIFAGNETTQTFLWNI